MLSFQHQFISQVKLLWLENLEKLILIVLHMLRNCNYFIAYTWLPMKWSLMSYTSTRINVSATVPYSMIKRSTEKIKRTKDVCTSMYSWDACSFSAHSIKLPLFGLLAFLVQTFSIVLGPYICTCTTERILAMVHYFWVS